MGFVVAMAFAVAPRTPALSDVPCAAEQPARNAELYERLGLTGRLPVEVFELCMAGREKLLEQGRVTKRDLLTIIDYSKPSTEERLFVLDLETGVLRHTSLVAHGVGSGDQIARLFSNRVASRQSSLGFFTTGATYQGAHGYSLELEGLEPDINDRAMERRIVIHGADYVSAAFAAVHGRIGRSWGCPALPLEQAHGIIDTIKDGALLFAYADDPSYLQQSKLLNLASSHASSLRQ